MNQINLSNEIREAGKEFKYIGVIRASRVEEFLRSLREEETWDYCERCKSFECHSVSHYKIVLINRNRLIRLAGDKLTSLTGDDKNEKLHKKAKEDAKTHGGYY